MKRIGLLGGMSWESTALYYQLCNEEIAKKLGGLHSADLVLVSVDFAHFAHLQAQGQWEEAGAELADKARTLEQAGADFVVLCTNTMHKVAPQIEAAIAVPLLHIVDVTAHAARRAGLRRLGLLATRFTMEQSFYRERMAAHGIDVIVPDQPGRELVHEIIYDELCRGVVADASRRRVLSIIDNLLADGVDGVILGCTEIELLIQQHHCEAPVLATTQLHVAAAVQAALDEPDLPVRQPPLP